MFRKITHVLALFVFSLILVPQYVTAKEVATTNYKSETKEDSKRIWTNLEEALVPASKSLAYLLTRTLPEVDGKPQPLNIKIAANPVDPDGPLQVVYHCAFGPQICKPFFEACAALYLQCSE